MDSLYSLFFELHQRRHLILLPERDICTRYPHREGDSAPPADGKLGDTRQARSNRGRSEGIAGQILHAAVEDVGHRAHHLPGVAVHVFHLWVGVLSTGGLPLCL